MESICDRVLIIREGEIVNLIDLKLKLKELGRIVEIKGSFSKEFIEKLSDKIISSEQGSYKIVYRGNIDEFIKAISVYDIEELSIRRENLEDTFIKYYEREEK